MRLRDIIALLLLVAVALYGQFSGDGDPAPEAPDNPRRPAPERFQDGGGPWDIETKDWMSQAPTRNPDSVPDWVGISPRSVVEIPERRRSGSGTAFAVGDGQWLTARHVIDGCDVVGILVAPRKGMKATRIEPHPSADVALLTTRNGPAPFNVADDVPKDGYMVGFPAGSPGAVHGRLIGQTTLREKGRYRTRETANVWSERSRIPDRFGSLGGLSGGPVFADDGRIVGVVLAEEPRRGRILSAVPETLFESMRKGGVPLAAGGGRGVGFAPETYPRTARELLMGLRVAKAVCRVG